MNQKHLLRFIKKKMKKHGDDVVSENDGKPVTLAEVRYRAFNAWCPLKCHTYLKKPAAFSRFFCLSIYDLLGDTRR